MNRKFHLGDVLSITTGYMVSPRNMDGIRDILCYMTEEDLTEQALPRVCENECCPELLRQHPQLAHLDLSEILPGDSEGCTRWLQKQISKFGEELEVAPLPPGAHVSIDPDIELEMVENFEDPEGPFPS